MRLLRLVPAAVLAVVLAGLAAPTASANAAPAARGRRPVPADASPLHRPVKPYRPTGRLQVKFKDGVTPAQQAAAYARVAARGLRVSVARRIDGMNAALLSVSDARGVLSALSHDSTVEFVEPESRYEAFADDPVTNELHEIQADTAHSQTPTPNVGTGTEIAVIDSQVDAANPDLDGAGKVTFAGDFTTAVPTDPNDPSNTVDEGPCTPAICPHGTAVADVAAGENGDGNMAGVAPGAGIRSYNVFRQFSYDNPLAGQPGEPPRLYTVGASSADIAAALTSIKTNIGSTPNLVAVNMSLGGRFDSELIRTAISDLHAAAPQLVVVVASGNDGGERANFPAGDPYVLTVGAEGQTPVFDSNGNYVPCPVTPPLQSAPWAVSEFSNRGDVDVVAPGRCVTSWYPTENSAGQVNSAAVLTKVDGTSFATPTVAGAVALLGQAGITGDRARAAIVAGADHSRRSVDAGAGPAKAWDAVTLATGSAAYTAIDVVRGAQVATVVGRRTVEAIRVEPGNTTTTTAAPVLAASSGYGSVTPTTTTPDLGITTVLAQYVPSTTVQTGQAFTLAANTALPAGDPDHPVVSMKMLDIGDSFEGQPMATGENSSVNLTYGSRSAYIRSAALASGTLHWTFTYNAASTLGADLWIWMPASIASPADGAGEPIAYEGAATVGPNPDQLTVGADCLGVPCEAGRYLIGWLTSSSYDDSDPNDPATRYQLSMTYNGPTATVAAPVYASNVSTTGPFGVAWGGANVTKRDVYWSYKTKNSSGAWVLSWHPWRIGTTTTSGTFGAGNVPTKVLQGVTYWFQVRSWDGLGNPSLSAVGATSAPFDDRYSGMAYASSWTSIAASNRWFGTIRKSGTAGASVTMGSETSRFTVIGDRCAACGQVRVYVDGVLKATVDTRASTTQIRRVLWTSAVFSGGPKPHKIKIVVVGTAGRPYFYLDGIAIYR